MEPKIKTAKELKIKAVEQAEQIDSAESNDDRGLSKARKVTIRSIPMDNKQKKARAANKRAKKARKINRK